MRDADDEDDDDDRYDSDSEDNGNNTPDVDSGDKIERLRGMTMTMIGWTRRIEGEEV
jgi:hypothetical protein